ncbi:ubiquitin recognition factor in er-associated degradation protein [Anaeramoeba ignava]|uniref:Ubiquitin recognition factor in er-associated degradation protein n=1 Tax=Anaeramoeba ignava TaxID=1746090 RepID=A0A9Q0LBE5_ANAIG|nr:ubiquitin recognition factor in er-associated degradation protein [Anaeramoeba ignava]
MMRRFGKIIRAYPASTLKKSNRDFVNGGKIVLSPHILLELTDAGIELPYEFALTNPTTGKKTHCGVLEFIADEGKCYIPDWMMDTIGLSMGNQVVLNSVKLPKGTFLKIQPHSSSFVRRIANPKVVLEHSLRKFNCLTTGDTFKIHYNKKDYYLNVLETKPGLAVNIVGADCNVEFAPAVNELDEIEKKQKEMEIEKQNKKDETQSDSESESTSESELDSEDDDNQKKEEPKIFVPFAGAGYRISNKPVIPLTEEEIKKQIEQKKKMEEKEEKQKEKEKEKAKKQKMIKTKSIEIGGKENTNEMENENENLKNDQKEEKIVKRFGRGVKKMTEEEKKEFEEKIKKAEEDRKREEERRKKEEAEKSNFVAFAGTGYKLGKRKK